MTARFAGVTRADVQDLAQRIKDTYNLTTLWLSFWPYDLPRIVINMIFVEKSDRGKGVGDRALREILQYADQHHLVVSLTLSSEFGSSKARLVKWYRRHGFVPNRGRGANSQVSETMIRKAR